jgi:flagellar biogenesis protein FliO
MSPLTSYAIETFVTLVAIVALAVLVLYAARRMGAGRPAGPLELLGRLPLDPRRVVYLVRVGRAVYVLAASEAGVCKLGELNEDELDLTAFPAPERSDFASVLTRALKRSPPKNAPSAKKDPRHDG